MGKPRSYGKVSLILRLLTLALLIIALAQPQQGESNKSVQASGIDIILAVDVSGSMNAMDFSLNGKRTNRLAVVKKTVSQFIEKRPNDRIGLIAFAGRPYVVSPPTLDHSWLNNRLEQLSVGMLPEKGTAIGSAIGSATKRLQKSDARSKLIVLLTDGINNAGKISPKLAASAAKTMNCKIYTIGAGTKGTAPYPTTDIFGRSRLVQAKVTIDDKSLTEVASATGGHYFRATDSESLAKVYSEIDSMEKTTRDVKKFLSYRELFTYLLALAAMLLLVELFYKKRIAP